MLRYVFGSSAVVSFHFVSKVSFQFVMSLVLHRVDKVLSQRGEARGRVQALPKEKNDRRQVKCQIPPLFLTGIGHVISKTFTRWLSQWLLFYSRIFFLASIDPERHCS